MRVRCLDELAFELDFFTSSGCPSSPETLNGSTATDCVSSTSFGASFTVDCSSCGSGGGGSSASGTGEPSGESSTGDSGTATVDTSSSSGDSSSTPSSSTSGESPSSSGESESGSASGESESGSASGESESGSASGESPSSSAESGSSSTGAGGTPPNSGCDVGIVRHPPGTVTCPAGMYDTGVSSCLWRAPGQDTCATCAAGTFASEGINAGCTQCPSDSICPNGASQAFSSSLQEETEDSPQVSSGLPARAESRAADIEDMQTALLYISAVLAVLAAILVAVLPATIAERADIFFQTPTVSTAGDVPELVQAPSRAGAMASMSALALGIGAVLILCTPLFIDSTVERRAADRILDKERTDASDWYAEMELIGGADVQCDEAYFRSTLQVSPQVNEPRVTITATPGTSSGGSPSCKVEISCIGCEWGLRSSATNSVTCRWQQSGANVGRYRVWTAGVHGETASVAGVVVPEGEYVVSSLVVTPTTSPALLANLNDNSESRGFQFVEARVNIGSEIGMVSGGAPHELGFALTLQPDEYQIEREREGNALTVLLDAFAGAVGVFGLVATLLSTVDWVSQYCFSCACCLQCFESVTAKDVDDIDNDRRRSLDTSSSNVQLVETA